MEPDFSGYATKAGLVCADGRTIMPDAFQHQDKRRVPLVWQHGHKDAENVLGHAILENRPDGVYTYGYFNTTPKGLAAKILVQHGDIDMLSIWANELVERAKQVFHGSIKEVSLVLSGANPGAKIDFVNIAHSNGDVEELDDEAIIYTGLQLEHAETKDDTTVEDVYNEFTEEQKTVVHFMIGAALEAAGSAEHSEIPTETPTTETPSTETGSEGTLTHQEGTNMTRNVFDQSGTPATLQARPHLTHDQFTTIMETWKRGGKLSEAILAHAGTYGIDNIDLLFPDAQTLDTTPEWVSRRMEWVSVVLGGVRKSPFSRIKSRSADITLDTARAKGYVKTNMKKDEFFGIAQRVTTPQTIYKKQKLDRDDIIDITDFDVVTWVKAEMRVMLDEELARAVLIGDGREPDDPDKIIETNVRPIAHDADFYTHKVTIPANTVGDAIVEAIVRARPAYRGAGNPTMFCVEELVTDLLLIKDKMGRRLYPTETELASALRVSRIVTVPVMEDTSTDGGDLLAVLVNLSDYTVGADKGGQLAMFDDFDIDYNQFKYLLETRVSGALTKHKTALVFSRGAGTLVTPAVPTFVPATGVVTIPSTTGVVYTQDGTVRTAGAQTAVAAGVTTEVVATPAVGYYFPHNIDADWEFTRNP